MDTLFLTLSLTPTILFGEFMWVPHLENESHIKW